MKIEARIFNKKKPVKSPLKFPSIYCDIENCLTRPYPGALIKRQTFHYNLGIYSGTIFSCIWLANFITLCFLTGQTIFIMNWDYKLEHRSELCTSKLSGAEGFWGFAVGLRGCGSPKSNKTSRGAANHRPRAPLTLLPLLTSLISLSLYLNSVPYRRLFMGRCRKWGTYVAHIENPADVKKN